MSTFEKSDVLNRIDHLLDMSKNIRSELNNFETSEIISYQDKEILSFIHQKSTLHRSIQASISIKKSVLEFNQSMNLLNSFEIYNIIRNDLYHQITIYFPEFTIHDSSNIVYDLYSLDQNSLEFKEKFHQLTDMSLRCYDIGISYMNIIDMKEFVQGSKDCGQICLGFVIETDYQEIEIKDRHFEGDVFNLNVFIQSLNIRYINFLNQFNRHFIILIHYDIGSIIKINFSGF